jgi:hypothetical protein
MPNLPWLEVGYLAPRGSALDAAAALDMLGIRVGVAKWASCISVVSPSEAHPRIASANRSRTGCKKKGGATGLQWLPRSRHRAKCHAALGLHRPTNSEPVSIASDA